MVNKILTILFILGLVGSLSFLIWQEPLVITNDIPNQNSKLDLTTEQQEIYDYVKSKQDKRLEEVISEAQTKGGGLNG